MEPKPTTVLHSPSLSDNDRKNLEDFDHLLRLIKARANGVAQRKHVGTYISGRTGTGKTWTVKSILDDLGINYQYINCRVSPGGLYDAMKQNPEDVIVLDDVATLYKHPQGLQVLLAALNGTAKKPRQISYVLKVRTEGAHLRLLWRRGSDLKQVAAPSSSCGRRCQSGQDS